MNKVNIGGDGSDRFYRYQRDRVQVKAENKHGAQTRILNLFAIARQLHVDVVAVAGFIKKTLGSNLTVDQGAQQCLMQGEVYAPKLEAVLVSFIAKHVLCVKCGLPELRDSVCLACGASQLSVKAAGKASASAQQVVSVAAATEVAAVKFDDPAEKLCNKTITEMLDWHDAWGQRRDLLPWGQRVDALRGRCWECQDLQSAKTVRRRWSRLVDEFAASLEPPGSAEVSTSCQSSASASDSPETSLQLDARAG